MSEDVVADGNDTGSGEGPAEPEGDASSGGASFEAETVDILEVRELVADVAETLLGHPFDGITTVEQSEDGGWRAVFEVVERSAVPDTQDIIGRYELFISEAGDVQEYSLQQRFKRGEMEGESL